MYYCKSGIIGIVLIFANICDYRLFTKSRNWLNFGHICEEVLWCRKHEAVNSYCHECVRWVSDLENLRTQKILIYSKIYNFPMCYYCSRNYWYLQMQRMTSITLVQLWKHSEIKRLVSMVLQTLVIQYFTCFILFTHTKRTQVKLNHAMFICRCKVLQQ